MRLPHNGAMQNSTLNTLSLFEASDLIASGAIKPAELLHDCVAQIERYQEQLRAFTTFDRDHLFAQLKAFDSEASRSRLFGIPVGIKDIMETAGLLTTMGSTIYCNYQPERDATIVAMLKTANALVAGKTETTEFAYFSPGKTRNPHHLDHTPGGSSMGSAAAVAKNMLPLALGTQTAGSVIRPAAYCGVAGYKASHGAVSLAGVCGFAQSLDSIGFFVRQVRDLLVVRQALFGASMKWQSLPTTLRVGLVKTPHWQLAQPAQRQVVETACNRLAQMGHQISEVQIGPSDGALTEAQMTVMAYEGCRSLSMEYAKFADLLSDPIKQLIENGRTVSLESYQDALNLAALWQQKLVKLFGEVDVLITPSAPGEAPKGLSNTGDPIFSRMWTLLKVPCIHLPFGTGTNGLPLGIQLIGPFNQDDRLISLAHHVETCLAGSTAD